LKKVKFSPESVTLTLDLSFLPGTFIKEGCKEFFPGLSLRKVARNINDHFNIELNYSTIYGMDSNLYSTNIQLHKFIIICYTSIFNFR
jgi:hypothetical protein